MMKTKRISLIYALAFSGCVTACTSCSTNEASEYSEWKPAADLLAKCEPIVQQFWWEHSTERRNIAWSSDIRVEDNGTNITLYIPDLSVRDEFTIRGMSFTNYHRHVVGRTEPDRKYLEYYFSPSPITNTSVRTYTTILGFGAGKTPVAFDFYIDLEEMKGYNKDQWLTKLADGHRTIASTATNQPALRTD